MESRLTTFQVRCEDALSEILEFHGAQLVNREINRDGEPYVHAQIAGANIEIWLYCDEAEYRAGRKRRNYEEAVFGNETETILSFVKDLEKELP